MYLAFHQQMQQLLFRPASLQGKLDVRLPGDNKAIYDNVTISNS